MSKRSSNGDGDILIKVGRTGSPIKEVVLNGDRTVADALKAAGLNKKDSETVQVNGDEIDYEDEYDMELEDGDRVVLVRNIEGGLR